MTTAQLTSLETIRGFLTAGNAIFTLVMKDGGARRTFRVRKTDGGHGWFVDVLHGPENGSDYHYIGFMWTGAGVDLHLKPKTDGRLTDNLKWMLNAINCRETPLVEENFNRHVEFWHAGYCGRCGRLLTDPESIARGLGPKCAGV